MIAMHAAERAANQQPQTGSLRITEVLPSYTGAPERPLNLAQSRALRQVLDGFRSAWKWIQQKRVDQLSTRRMRLAETISLGEKRSVAIVQVDGAQFLLGCGTEGVRLLARLDEQRNASATKTTQGSTS